MKKYIIGLFFIISRLSQAQTLLEDQFQFNYLALNPAFTGARQSFSMNAMLGSQFNPSSFRPQPIYQLFSTDGPIQQGRGGLGFQAFNSNVANYTNSGVKVSYAYHYELNEGSIISLGADAGLIYQPVLTGNSGTGVKQLYPYAGIGGVYKTETLIIGISKPVLLMNSAGLIFNNKKPLYSMIGFSMGEYDGTMLNFTGILETNKNVGTNFSIGGKAWFNRILALGALFRSEKQLERINKIVPTAEWQISDAIRMGVSYDTKPTPYSNTTQPNYKQGGVLQLYLRFEGQRDDRLENRLKYF